MGYLKGEEGPELPYSNETTSLEAAESKRPTVAKQRTRVFETIKNSGQAGITDEEGQILTNISGNAWRPRRRELEIRREVFTNGKKRKTLSGGNALLWFAH